MYSETFEENDPPFFSPLPPYNYPPLHYLSLFLSISELRDEWRKKIVEKFVKSCNPTNGGWFHPSNRNPFSNFENWILIFTRGSTLSKGRVGLVRMVNILPSITRFSDRWNGGWKLHAFVRGRGLNWLAWKCLDSSKLIVTREGGFLLILFPCFFEF